MVIIYQLEYIFVEQQLETVFGERLIFLTYKKNHLSLLNTLDKSGTNYLI